MPEKSFKKAPKNNFPQPIIYWFLFYYSIIPFHCCFLLFLIYLTYMILKSWLNQMLYPPVTPPPLCDIFNSLFNCAMLVSHPGCRKFILHLIRFFHHMFQTCIFLSTFFTSLPHFFCFASFPSCSSFLFLKVLSISKCLP